MFLERIRLKRQLASRDAAVRLRAVAALDGINDNTLLLQLAADDVDGAVRAAAINRCCDPDMILALLERESDPGVLQQIRRRADQLFAELALQACAEERECDAFERIVSNDTLISVALRSNSPTLVLAAGARLTAHPDMWLQLMEQLNDDKLALELYTRNAPDPDSRAAARLLSSARSQALRQAIAAERARRQALAQAYAGEAALVEAAEACAESGDEEKFEYLTRQYRSLPAHHEDLKTRFMAARYRFFQAREEMLARRENEIRDRQVACELFRQLEGLRDSGNWKLIRQITDTWKQRNLSNSAGAAEFAPHFNALAAELAARAESRQKLAQQVMETVQKVGQSYQEFAQSAQVPSWEQRQTLLGELDQAIAQLPELPLDIAEARACILNMERQLRRRAHQEAQERDLARWEHYTCKCDICEELEKLANAPDEHLGEVARIFRNLREKWNAIGGVPNEKFAELRERYQTVCSTLHGRLDKFYAERQAAQQQALLTKQALLSEAETLSGSDDWSETSNRLKDLQNMWKTAGSAGGQADRELFEKFHAACDAFFVRRNAVWEDRKRGFLAAAGRKRELCAAAEALKDKPFDQAKNEIAALREAWRNIPSAGKDDRLLYMQFNRAIDDIFTAHREAGDAVRRQAEIVCTSLADLLKQARSGSLPIREIEQKQQENQQQWEALDTRGLRDAARRREVIAGQLQDVLCNLHHQEAMHKLNAAEQLEAVIETPVDEAKLIDHLGRRLKVCGELEERLRECQIISGGGDLAGELQQAIAGNFGGSSYRMTVAELDEFLQRFVAVGCVPPDAREAVFERFKTLYNRALDVLQQSENSPAEDFDQE